MKNFVLTLFAIACMVLFWQIAVVIVLIWLAFEAIRFIWVYFLRDIMFGKDPNK